MKNPSRLFNAAVFKPNYKKRCMVCEGRPTVDIYDAKGEKKITSTEMCGVCTWGEAECHDPANW